MEGERGEHLSLLKGAETKEKLELEKRLEELGDLEKVNEDMKGVVAQLEAAIQSQGIDHESEIALIRRRFDDDLFPLNTLLKLLDLKENCVNSLRK